MQDFTAQQHNDTIANEVTWEEEKMLARYHFQNTIYLYGAFEKNEANHIIGNNDAELPLVLYETPMSAYEEGSNIQNKAILRFAVDIGTEPYLDYLIPESRNKLDKMPKEQLKDYKNACKYIRKYDNSKKKIVYTINNKLIILNVQEVY